MENLSTREATLDDLDDIMAIEEESFAAPWSRDSWERELKSPLTYYEVLLYLDVVIGYVGAWLLGDQAHIGRGRRISRKRLRPLYDEPLPFRRLRQWDAGRHTGSERRQYPRH